MSKTLKVYIVLLIAVFLSVAAIEFSLPKLINWSPTYNETHKFPYGTYVLYDQLNNIFPNNKIKNIRKTPYEYFNSFFNRKDGIYNTSGTYITVSYYSNLDHISAQELLKFASCGNDVFMSTNYPPQTIQDSLNINTINDFNSSGKVSFSLANPSFKNDSISINKDFGNYYFNTLDSANSTVLGYQDLDSTQRINFVKVKYGKGNFFLHLQPVAFTNYNLLKKNNSKYAEAVLSYLKNDTIHFDSKNKTGKTLGSSPLRFVLKTPPLRWAWHLALLTLICFIIFNAKRKQRIVKIIKPNENTTVAFTKTIGNLYYETKDHNGVINKKINYFLEYVRRNFHIDTQVLDNNFVKNLSLKSNKNQEEINRLVHLILQLKTKSNCEKSDLLQLNKAIEAYYIK